jgi:hypothetical protein
MTDLEIEKLIETARKKGRAEACEMFLEHLNEFRLIQEDHDEYDRRQNIRDYAAAKKQIEVMQPLTFGADIHVLLLTDRLHGCAKGLREYLNNSADMTVDFAHCLDKVQVIASQKRIDVLIIVGLQKDSKNYGAIQAVKKKSPSAAVIMHAFLDNVIKNICAENSIVYLYDRHDPMDGFVSYMRKVYARESTRVLEGQATEIKKGLLHSFLKFIGVAE